jgi:hypothetical protein
LLLPAPQFSLAQNFPNPFSGKTYISYELAKRSPVELLILDSSNERPIVLVSDVQEAVTYVISVDAQILKQPGTYTYQLRAGAFSQSRTLDRVNGSKR